MSNIRDPQYIGQVIDFQGMQYGNCSPTDIDLSMDFKGEVFFFIELKWGHATLPLGQRIHLEHLVNGLREGGKLAYAIHARHDTPRGDVIVGSDAVVKQCYYGRDHGWEKKEEVKLHEFIKKKHEVWKELR